MLLIKQMMKSSLRKLQLLLALLVIVQIVPLSRGQSLTEWGQSSEESSENRNKRNQGNAFYGFVLSDS